MKIEVKNHIVALILSVEILWTLGDSNFCPVKKSDSEKDECDEFHQERPTWKDYLQKIEAARNDHVACEGLQCYLYVLERDLGPFRTISLASLDRARQLASHPVTYQIVSGRVYRSKDCLFPTRCQGIEHFLLRVVNDLPRDVEIVVNTHDWPFVNKHFEPTPVPLFSFSKTKYYHDISYPAWSFWAGGPAIGLYPTGLGRWDRLRETLFASAKRYPWPSKDRRGFFRGSRTSVERDPIVLLSRRKPQLVDARYTKNQAWKSRADTLGEDPAEEVSLENHCRFKYLFNYRGVAASFRFRHLFLCGSLVFHVGNEWTEFFYPALVPWFHYIPVASNASESDLEDLLDFANTHSDTAAEIAERGRAFVTKNLDLDTVQAYWKILLIEYAKKLDFDVEIRQEYIEIK